MGLIRTYVDAGVLIAAARAAGRIAADAIGVLDDPRREFVASGYLKLEVIPKAQFHASNAELALYREFFDVARTIVPFDSAHFDRAFDLACSSGLAAFDALHIVAAMEAGCAEFVTSERRTSPLFRITGIHIFTIASS